MSVPFNCDEYEIEKPPTHNKTFLNKNLFFNIESKENYLNDYYLHTFTKNINIQNYESIKGIITNFTSQRSKNSVSDDFICLNKNSLLSYNMELDDKDFYIETLGCVFCKEILNNYAALFLHYKLNHQNYTFFNIKHHNCYTNLKEAHIVGFHCGSDKKKLSIRNSDSDRREKLIQSEILDKRIEFFFNQDDKEALVMKTLEDKDELKRILSTNDDKSKQKNLMNSHKQLFRQYVPNPDSYIDDKLILFDCVTGEMLDENYQSRGYEIEGNNYIIRTQEQWIDDICDDVNPEDKTFMKCWNLHSDKYNK